MGAAPGAEDEVNGCEAPLSSPTGRALCRAHRRRQGARGAPRLTSWRSGLALKIGCQCIDKGERAQWAWVREPPTAEVLDCVGMWQSRCLGRYRLRLNQMLVRLI